MLVLAFPPDPNGRIIIDGPAELTLVRGVRSTRIGITAPATTNVRRTNAKSRPPTNQPVDQPTNPTVEAEKHRNKDVTRHDAAETGDAGRAEQ